jgi:hypothetical protein
MSTPRHRALRLLLALPVYAAIATGVEGQTFRAAPEYPVAPGPSLPTVADFNRDGRPDVAVLSTTASVVSILYGSPGGASPGRVDYAAGADPYGLDVADFNGDSRLDIMVSGGGPLRLLLGNAAGGFDLVPVDPGPEFSGAIAAGDVNGDGRVDLVLLNYSTATSVRSVELWLGNGAGGFAAAGTIRTEGFRESVTGIAVADLTSDGRPDVLLDTSYHGIFAWTEIFVQGAGGAFTSAGTVDGIRAVRGDWNEDGIVDLATMTASPVPPQVVRVHLGNGNGTYTSQGTDQPHGGGLAAGDFNGDGNADLAVGGEPFTLLLGDGAGHFTPLLRGFGPRLGPLVATDLDLDGDLDLAGLTVSGTVAYVLGDGAGDFVAIRAFAILGNGQGVTTGDFNGDSHTDVVSGQIVQLGDGNGNLGSATMYDLANNLHIAAGRLNGDAHPDLAVTRGTDAVAVYLGNGAGGFQAANSHPAGLQPIRPTLGDFDADGHTDVAVVNSSSEAVSVLLGDGTGALGAAASFGVGAVPWDLAVGRLNADVFPDLVATLTPGTVRVLLADGSGGFVAGGIHSTSAILADPVLADFNQDSRLDLAVAGGAMAGGSGVVTILLGDGLGGFGPAQHVTLDHAARSLAVGDFDLDGDLDLAAHVVHFQPFSGQMVVLRGDGAGGFTPGPQVHMPHCRETAAADFTGDARLDIVCRSNDAPYTWLLLNTTVLAAPVNVSVAEGDATGVAHVSVLLLHPSEQTVTLGYSTADGTASAGSDYAATGGSITFPPGITLRTVPVAVLGDRVHEADETILFNLTGPPGVTIGPPATITLTNDDPAGLSIGDVAVREGAAGPATARYTVTLAPSSADSVTVNFATAGGTATAGSDFTPVAGQLTFAPGITTQPVDVPILQDAAVEGAETFSVGLSGAVGAGIAHATGAGIILDRLRGSDFNADALSDLVWRHDVSGENVLWFMNGIDLVSGTFTNPAVLADTRWKVVGTNDFDADGRADLLWRHATSGENVVWFMNGPDLVGGTFTTPTALVDVRWQMVGTGDFNLDGSPDILWRHDTAGENVLWYMNGTVLTGGTFTTPPSLEDVRWKMAGVGDFNRDGKPDVLWHHQLSGQAVLWYMDGSVLIGGTFTQPNGLPNTDWRMVAVADYNGDDRPDIVWRHRVSGQNVVWFMHDATLIVGAFTNPSTLPDQDWKLVGPR